MRLSSLDSPQFLCVIADGMGWRFFGAELQRIGQPLYSRNSAPGCPSIYSNKLSVYLSTLGLRGCLRFFLYLRAMETIVGAVYLKFVF